MKAKTCNKAFLKKKHSFAIRNPHRESFADGFKNIWKAALYKSPYRGFRSIPIYYTLCVCVCPNQSCCRIILPDRPNCATSWSKTRVPKSGRAVAFGRSDGPPLVAKKLTQFWGQVIDWRAHFGVSAGIELCNTLLEQLQITSTAPSWYGISYFLFRHTHKQKHVFKSASNRRGNIKKHLRKSAT